MENSKTGVSQLQNTQPTQKLNMGDDDGNIACSNWTTRGLPTRRLDISQTGQLVD